MNSLTSLVAVAIALLASGCASQLVWYQDGKTFTEADRDFRECKFEAVKHGYVQASPFGDPIASGAAAGIEQGIRQNDIMRSCMEAKGYRLIPANQTTTDSHPAPGSAEAIRRSSDHETSSTQVDIVTLMRAAEAGAPSAQAQLAEFLYAGKHGLMTNRVEAYKWAKLAASQENVAAKHLVWEMELFMSSKDLSDGKAAADMFLQRRREKGD